MSLAAGTRLGPYEILGSIGAGGMGEVYRAHDAKLHRDVALKILPDAFATDSDRLARFRREARMLAALNHPNIGQIYGFEDSGGSHALVLELIEGVTLEALIDGGDLAPIERPSHQAVEMRHGAKSKRAGGLSLDQAIPIARQIAEALEAAHEQGLVHRDLKPANVKVRNDGTVKVLDFGLAKALDPAESSTVEAMNAPTATAQPNELGLILGTAAYMAPEQARGRTVDKRADIWAFGAVLYEMLTGQRAFKGEDVSETLASVLRHDLDWTALPAATPAPIQRLLARCLERDVKRRLRDIGEARIVLADPATSETTSDPASRGSWRWAPWAAAAVLALIGGVGWWGWLHRPPTPARTVTRSATNLASFAVSPVLSGDGTRLVYSNLSGGQPGIWMRQMDQLEGTPVPGAGSGSSPVFSPDAEWIAYFSTTSPATLKKIRNTGGTAISLCDAPEAAKATWGDDNTLVFGSTKGLMQVAAAGGTPQPLTTLNAKAGETSHGDPQFLPGGQALLFTVYAGSISSARIALLDLKTRTHRVLVNSGADAHYVPTGHLVYERGETLFAAPFSIKRLEVTGAEAAVLEGVAPGGYSFSASGLLVFRASSGSGPTTTSLEWTNRQGVAQPLPEPPHPWGTFALSPDGRSVAGSILAGREGPADEHSDIWIYELARHTLQRLTFEGWNAAPIWTPDGRWVTFGSTLAGKHGIYRVPLDAGSSPELLVAAESHVSPLSWTPDGRSLLYSQRSQRSDIWVLPVPTAGPGTPRPFLQTSFNENDAQVAPDGKWVAYTSDESGRDEVYVVPFPGPGGKSQISTEGGTRPQWSSNGRELFYANRTNQVMALDVQAEPSFHSGRPHPLFKLTPGGPVWQVTRDPQRFLVERVPERATTTTFVVITDWFEDLRRRLPDSQ